jgi:hypothetical protein
MLYMFKTFVSLLSGHASYIPPAFRLPVIDGALFNNPRIGQNLHQVAAE